MHVRQPVKLFHHVSVSYVYIIGVETSDTWIRRVLTDVTGPLTVISMNHDAADSVELQAIVETITRMEARAVFDTAFMRQYTDFDSLERMSRRLPALSRE